MSAGLADALTRAALDIYAALPTKGKPGKRGGNGSPEWTVLAAFLVFRALEGSDDCWEVRCVSLGTGLRALPHARLPVHGDVLHDSHAEVIARRGFHCWLYDEVVRSNSGDETSVLQEVEGKGGEKEWRLRDGWKVGMYVSTLPCGDASTYLLAVQDADNSASSSAAPPPTVSSSPSPARSTPTESTAAALHPSLSTALSLGLSLSRSTSISPSCSSPASTLPPSVIRGRNDYTSLSTLRTKPGRADSPPTTSHSCSDKIALWALLGVQGGLLSVLGVRRMPVEMLVVGSEGVPSGGRDRVREEIRRAVGGRLEDWVEKVGLRDEFVVPTVEWTDRGFVHSREAVARRGGVGKEAVAGCPETFSYVLGASPAVEVVTGGIRQSASSKRNPGEALGPKQRSRLCKLSLFQRHLEVSALLASPPPAVPPSSPFASPISLTYHSHKHSPRTLLATTHDALDLNLLAPLHRYQLVKALVRRRVDASTSTSEPVGFGARSREDGPFAGWLVSGKEWESFNGEGRVVVEEL